MIPHAVLDALIDRVVGAVHPQRIILFGSAARNEMGPDSDLDVLVVVADGTRQGEVSAAVYRALRRFGYPVDVVVVRESDLALFKDHPGMVYQRALADGREIYHAA